MELKLIRLEEDQVIETEKDLIDFLAAKIAEYDLEIDKLKNAAIAFRRKSNDFKKKRLELLIRGK